MPDLSHRFNYRCEWINSPNTIQITLLANDNTAHLVDALEIENLVVQGLNHLE
jgi:hypothetical protein